LYQKKICATNEKAQHTLSDSFLFLGFERDCFVCSQCVPIKFSRGFYQVLQGFLMVHIMASLNLSNNVEIIFNVIPSSILILYRIDFITPTLQSFIKSSKRLNQPTKLNMRFLRFTFNILLKFAPKKNVDQPPPPPNLIN
jgi:hypothetical protein